MIQLCLNLAKEWFEKLRAEFFEGKTQGLKERRAENCVLDAVNQTDVCIIHGITLYGGFLFFFFSFIFYSLNFFLRKSWYETQVTSAGTVEETGYESPQTSKMKTTVLQIILEAPWPCTCNPLYFVHILWLNKLMRCFFRVLWHDVTAAILVFQNTPCGNWTLFSCKNFFCSNRLA